MGLVVILVTLVVVVISVIVVVCNADAAAAPRSVSEATAKTLVLSSILTTWVKRKLPRRPLPSPLLSPPPSCYRKLIPSQYSLCNGLFYTHIGLI